MSNIFKMTPEMVHVLFNPNPEETSLGDSLSTSTSFPTHPTSNSQPAPSNDPFGISTSRVNTESRQHIGKSGLFEKLNGSTTNLATPIAGGANFDAIETPTGAALAAVPRIREPISGYPEAQIAIEPPQAPPRKPRTLAGIGLDFNSADAPPRMKSSQLRNKSKPTTVSGETDTIGSVLTSFSGITDRKRTVSGQVSQSVSTNPLILSLNAASNDPTAGQRRSIRLFNQIRPQSNRFSASTGNLSTKDGREIKKARAPGTKGRSTQSTVGRVVSGNRKHGDPMDIDSKESRPPSGTALFNPKSVVNEKGKEYESLQWILDLFMKLGSGYFALSHYQCHEALQIFNSVTSSQRETPWVLAQIGRSLYEQANYVEAAKYYARIKTMAPSRLEDMEFYSTILWHLKNEIDLAFVAHEIIDIDRNSPQAWCAVGNSFSLQRDHDQALKCFRRATQLRMPSPCKDTNTLQTKNMTRL